MCFINKLDRTGANFFMCVDMIRERLGAKPLLLQLPIGLEADLKGIVDLVKMKGVIWNDESLGAKFEEVEIPENLKEEAEKYRKELVETAVEQDEDLMAAYLDGKDISEDDLKKCIRKGTLDFSFVPIVCGSAFKNKGVQPLLDAVVDYLPSPLDIGEITGTKPGTEDEIVRKFGNSEPFSALAFKVANDPFVGSLTFIRIYSGTLNAATGVMNTSKDKEERVGRMLLMHANDREDIKTASTGDIVALAGLKHTITGHTLSDPSNPILLEPMDFPDPVIEIAVEPKTKADQEKMGEALARLAKEDPSFRVSSDNESGQTIIKGMGELHLDIIVDRMKREFKVEANIGAPQVAYRETIQGTATVDYTHKKQSGGAGQFAKVKLSVEPLEPGKGREIENIVKGGSIPKEFIPGVEKGIEGVADSGILAGFPMLDYKVTIIDGLHHDVDSSVLAFEIAGRMGFKEACTKAGLKLLEPIMKVEVVTPEDHMGDVIGDLNSRRGQIGSTDKRGNATVINAMVPLANMFGYVNNLRSMSQGRAQYTMTFDHYEKVPQNVQDEVTKKLA
jgi:elongation factor G